MKVKVNEYVVGNNGDEVEIPCKFTLDPPGMNDTLLFIVKSYTNDGIFLYHVYKTYIAKINHLCWVGYLSNLHHTGQSEAVIFHDCRDASDVNVTDNQYSIHNKVSLYHNLYGESSKCSLSWCFLSKNSI